MLVNVASQRKPLAIHAVLRDEILGGVWAVGSQLPNEVEMARRFECSAGTVNKAVALLVHEGLVVRKNRSGTRVVSNTLPSEPKQVQLDAFAFIYPSEQHEGIWRTVKGFQDAAREAGRRVVMLSTGPEYEKEAEFIGRLSEFDVKGAVVYSIIPTPQDQVHFSQLLVNSKFPVVLAEVNLPGLGCPSVVVDGFHAGYTMTRHMIERGAKRIGFFSNYSWAPFMRDRHRGYCWALDEARISEPKNGVYLGTAMHPDFHHPLDEPTQLAEVYLSSAEKLDAVVCADDFLALGCIVAARKEGRQVPADLLVSGMGDYSALASSMGVPLTTYRIPFEQMGQKSFDALNFALAGNSGLYSESQLRGTLVIRESA